MIKRIVLLLVIFLMVFSVIAEQDNNRQFFRVASDTTTVITAFNPEGWLSWSNVVLNGTCTVERAYNLSGTNVWQPYFQQSITSVLMNVRCLDSGTPADMSYIPAGSFQMGDSFGEGYSHELPVHTVHVGAFYMDKYEVTKFKWDEVANWATTNGYDISANNGLGKAVDHPVQDVTWYECVKWCNARSQMVGRTPCYTISGNTYKAGENDSVVCDWSANGYRLPTEAEWEKAARGGLSGRRFPWGDTIQHACANYYSMSSYGYDTSPTRGYQPDYDDGGYPYTSPVGSLTSNGYGLYDMTGDVWEWCNDWYDSSYYSSSPDSNPHGPSTGSDRMRRGGSWSSNANDCRVAYRLNSPADISGTLLGFRVVISPGSASAP